MRLVEFNSLVMHCMLVLRAHASYQARVGSENRLPRGNDVVTIYVAVQLLIHELRIGHPSRIRGSAVDVVGKNVFEFKFLIAKLGAQICIDTEGEAKNECVRMVRANGWPAGSEPRTTGSGTKT